MRIVPSLIGYSNARITDENNNITPSAIVASNRTSVNVMYLNVTVVGATQYRPYLLVGNDTAGFIDASAEL